MRLRCKFLSSEKLFLFPVLNSYRRQPSQGRKSRGQKSVADPLLYKKKMLSRSDPKKWCSVPGLWNINLSYCIYSTCWKSLKAEYYDIVADFWCPNTSTLIILSGFVLGSHVISESAPSIFMYTLGALQLVMALDLGLEVKSPNFHTNERWRTQQKKW